MYTISNIQFKKKVVLAKYEYIENNIYKKNS